MLLAEKEGGNTCYITPVALGSTVPEQRPRQLHGCETPVPVPLGWRTASPLLLTDLDVELL